MPSRPPLGAPVTLERAGAVWVEAETSRYDGADIVLAPSEGTVALGAVPVPVVLCWTTPRGVFRVDATVRQHAGECRVSPVAEADRTQRREYPRLPLGTPMRLSAASGLFRATLADVSEAALRVRLPRPDGHDGAVPRAGLQAGDDVRAAFTLHETGFVLQGTVLREQPGDEPGTVDVVVLLDIPARTANDLRRSVAFARAEREAP